MPTNLIPYADGSTFLEGFAAYTIPEKRPAVILCHAWSGRDLYVCEKAEMMARWGYFGFALDMYGKGVLGKSKEENAGLKKPFLEDRALLQRRLLRAFETVGSLPHVDPNKIAAVGFGFGGLCALDFARSGAALRGVVSIYGHFDRLPPHLMKPIQAKILVLHGYDDPIVKQDELRSFAEEMTEAKVDWQAHVYSNTQHAFMNPAIDDPKAGLSFHPVSSQRAWHAIQGFLEEIFEF
jgi:dienelactone hydrolase